MRDAMIDQMTKNMNFINKYRDNGGVKYVGKRNLRL